MSVKIQEKIISLILCYLEKCRHYFNSILYYFKLSSLFQSCMKHYPWKQNLYGLEFSLRAKVVKFRINDP